MGLFSKKKNNTEEIPSLPKLPELPMESLNLPDTPPGLPNIETYPLNSFLNNKPENNFTQAVKQEVNDPNNEYSHSFFEKQTKQLNAYNPEDINRSINTERRTIELPEFNNSRFNNSNKTIKQAEPIYVRLDKFEITVETFRDIKNKIIEIEDLLERTKKIKQDEEKELDSWEREIQMIKSRLDLIDKSIFNKLD
ncbi:MAG: hypothetical protein AABW67_06500 [Nanoarchaeota archaeon]